MIVLVVVYTLAIGSSLVFTVIWTESLVGTWTYCDRFTTVTYLARQAVPAGPDNIGFPGSAFFVTGPYHFTGLTAVQRRSSEGKPHRWPLFCRRGTSRNMSVSDLKFVLLSFCLNPLAGVIALTGVRMVHQRDIFSL